jgi:hypothetical protein
MVRRPVQLAALPRLQGECVWGAALICRHLWTVAWGSASDGEPACIPVPVRATPSTHLLATRTHVVELLWLGGVAQDYESDPGEVSTERTGVSLGG